MISNVNNNKFKDDKGRWRTLSLFYESYRSEDVSERYPYIYTLKDHDYDELISIKKLYIAMEDPTEYRIATEYFGGWEHWKVLCAAKWFQVHLEIWREELEVKMKCKAIAKVLELSNSTGAVAKDASKFIVNKEWEVKRGRPSKGEIERQKRISSNISQQIDSDFKLLNLNER